MEQSSGSRAIRVGEAEREKEGMVQNVLSKTFDTGEKNKESQEENVVVEVKILGESGQGEKAKAAEINEGEKGLGVTA